MSASKFVSAFGVLATISSLATLVQAHGIVTGIVADGTYYGGYLVTQYPYTNNPPEVVGWTETATDLGFVDQYNSDDIICHKGATNAKKTATVAAGGKVTFQWGIDVWPESHHGPVLGYLANCNGDCTSVDKTALKFVKVDEGGLVDATTPPYKWASDDLIANNNSWTTTIPANIAPGEYVFRHEIIALHSAGSANGAQAYPFCVNLQITGGGSAAPEGTLGTQLYSATDPGIQVSIYGPGLKYQIPGPAIPAEFGGSGSGGSSSGDAAPAPTSATASSRASAVPTSAISDASSVSSQVAVVTSVPATTASAAPSAVLSAISSLTAALPSSVLTSAAPTPTGSSGSGTTIDTSGMTVAELLDLLKQVLTQLFSSGGAKARRHARDVVA